MKFTSFQYLILSVIPFLFCICSCNNHHDSEKKINHQDVISKPIGLYINATAIKNDLNTFIGDIPHYCFELNFLTKDSASIDNGFEFYKLKYTFDKHNTFKLINASFKGDMYFEILNDTSIVLYDTAWTDLKTPTVFIKAKSGLNFEKYLNIKNIVGSYSLKKIQDASIQNIEFTLQGKINGCKDFDSFQLCYAGDCLDETLEKTNTILLISKTYSDSYSIIKDTHSSHLFLYSLAPSKKDIKGARALGKIKYELIPKTQ